MAHVRTAVLTQADGGRWSFTTETSKPPEWLVEDVSGWYGGAGVRGAVTARLGHGDFVERGFREGRVMTLHGHVACESVEERDWQERNLSGMGWSGEWADLTCDDGNAVLSARVRLDGAPQVVKDGPRSLALQLPLVSESPFLFGEWREVGVFPPGAGTGFVFPPFAEDLGEGPVISFGTAVQSSSPIWNDGNASSLPVFTVTADSPAGFTVGFGGARVSYSWPTFKNVPVTVDMAGSITVGGVDQTHLVGRRDWGGVAPKSIETPFLRFIGGDGDGWANVRFRDTYI